MRRLPLEEQLTILANCGIALRPGLGVAHLLHSFSREEYEADPFQLALAVLGSEGESEPYEYLSDDVWHFDTECIYDHGDYVAIAKRMRDLAHGDLPIESIKDYVDVEAGTAWLSFRLDGQEHRWEATVQDDWVDPDIFSRFAELLAERNTERRFTYCDLGGGQDCLIGCSTPTQLERLRERTGLDFQWLG